MMQPHLIDSYCFFGLTAFSTFGYAQKRPNVILFLADDVSWNDLGCYGNRELHTEPPVEMVSFPEILKQQGYYTGHAGKFHMGKYALRGFDVTNETGDDIPQNLTKDWYKKDAGTMKTSEFGHRGGMPGEKRHATQNNNKGKF